MGQCLSKLQRYPTTTPDDDDDDNDGDDYGDDEDDDDVLAWMVGRMAGVEKVSTRKMTPFKEMWSGWPSS